MLKADTADAGNGFCCVDHHCRKSNSPVVQFQVHIATSVVCGKEGEEREEKEKKKNKKPTRECLKEVFITKMNSKFYHIFHISLYKTFIAQGTHSLCTLYSAVIPSQKTVRPRTGAHTCMYAHTRTAAVVRKAQNVLKSTWFCFHNWYLTNVGGPTWLQVQSLGCKGEHPYPTLCSWWRCRATAREVFALPTVPWEEGMVLQQYLWTEGQLRMHHTSMASRSI